MPSLLTASALCERLPHSGRMCLLDGVVAWDGVSIHCMTQSHVGPDNPLRVSSGLPAISGVEYAAQAMAIHGGLCAGHAEPRIGVLAAVRNLQLHTDWLNEHRGKLEIFAERLHGDEGANVYAFRITSAARFLLSGRLTVTYLTPGAAS